MTRFGRCCWEFSAHEFFPQIVNTPWPALHYVCVCPSNVAIWEGQLVLQVAAGSELTVAVTSGGQVVASGYDNQGQCERQGRLQAKQAKHSHSDPSHSDPSHSDPSHGDPNHSDTCRSDSNRSDPRAQAATHCHAAPRIGPKARRPFRRVVWCATSPARGHVVGRRAWRSAGLPCRMHARRRGARMPVREDQRRVQT